MCTAAVLDCLTDELPSTLYFIAVPCQGWRTDTCLPFFQNACNDVTGKEPRLWSCSPAAATESYIQDTLGSLEPSLASPTRGSRREVLLSPRVWKGCHWVGTRDWYLMHYSNPPVTGGQKKNTHTHTSSLHHFEITSSTSVGTLLGVGNPNLDNDDLLLQKS